MITWKFLGWFGIPQPLKETLPVHSVPAGEREPGQKVREHTSYLHRGNLVFTAITLLFWYGVLLLLYQGFAIAYYRHITIWSAVSSIWFWKAVGKGFVSVWFSLRWMAKYHPFVDGDTLGVLQFLGTRFYTRCRPFLPPWEKVARLILIPGGPQIEDTPSDTNSNLAVFSQVKQRRGIVEKDADGKEIATDYSDRQFFQLNVMYRLDIFRHPERVLRNFLRYFVYDYEKGEHKFTAMKRDVLSQILGIIKGRSDEVLSKLYMDQMIQDNGDVAHTDPNAPEREITAAKAMGVEDVNTLLFKHLSRIMSDIGVELMQITISDIKDTHPNGYITQLRRKATAQQVGEADKTEARMQADARNIEAQQEQQARISEAQARFVIAEQDARTAAEEVKVARNVALRDQQPFQVMLEMMNTEAGLRGAAMANMTRLVYNNPLVVQSLFTALGYNNNNTIFNGGDIIQELRKMGVDLLTGKGIPSAPVQPAAVTTPQPAATSTT